VADPADTVVSSVFRLPPVQGRGPDYLPFDPWFVTRTPASGAFAWLDDLDAALDDLLRRRLDLENFR
jgi:hypothetical protein